MKLVRRSFLKLGLFSSVMLQVPAQAGHKKLPPLIPLRGSKKLSIIQGATDHTATQFSILQSRDQELYFSVLSASRESFQPDHVELVTFEDEESMLAKVYFSGLKPEEDYQLLVFDQASQLIDQREFKTLKWELDGLRFAIASCMDDGNHKADIWQEMVEQNPDLIFYVGDSVYADYGRSSEDRGAADPLQLWQRFCDARWTLEIYQSRKLIPILATWDDHDFGRNDIGADFQYVAESQANFMNFFAQNESHCTYLKPGPGVSSAFHFGSHLFLMMDDRSFRLGKSVDERYSQWGQEQEDWALEQMDQHDGAIWIMNGSQMVPAMIFKESVSKHHSKNLAGFFEGISEKPGKAVLISGDVHFSELSELEDDFLGYSSFEITSSSIHSPTLPGVPELIMNKRRIVSTGKRNFVIVNAHWISGQIQMEVTSHSAKGEINFQKNLKV